MTLPNETEKPCKRIISSATDIIAGCDFSDYTEKDKIISSLR